MNHIESPVSGNLPPAPSHHLTLASPAIDQSLDELICPTVASSPSIPVPSVMATAAGSFASIFSGADPTDKVPEKFRWATGEEHILVVPRHEPDYLVVYVHDSYKHGIPELDGVPVRCQAGCPLCLAGKLPQCNMILPAVDVGTLVTGLVIAATGCSLAPGASISMEPHGRFQVNFTVKTLFGMLYNALKPLSPVPANATLRIAKPRDNAYLVLPATIAPEFQPPPELITQAINAARSHRAAIEDTLGMTFPVATLRDIPTIDRMLRLSGKI